MQRTYTIQTAGILSLLFLPGACGLAAAENPSPRKTASPAKTKSTARPITPAKVLPGHLRLLDKSLQEAVTGMQQRSATRLAAAQKKLILTYGDVANAIQSACRRNGAAQSQLDVARDVVQQLGTDKSERALTRDRLEAVTAGVNQARGEMVDRLTAARSKLTDKLPVLERRRILQQLALLSERIEQLDAVLESKDEAVADGFDAKTLATPLDRLAGQLNDERRLLGVQAEAVAELVESSHRHMDKALAYLAVQAEIPFDLVAEMRGVRRSVAKLLDRVSDVRRQRRQDVQRAVHRAASDTWTPVDKAERQLVERVDRLLVDPASSK